MKNLTEKIQQASVIWTHFRPDLDALMSLALAKRAGFKGEIRLLPAGKWHSIIKAGEVGLDVGNPAIEGVQDTEQGGIAFKGDNGLCAAAALAQSILSPEEYRATASLWDAVNAADHGEVVESLRFMRGAASNQGLNALDWMRPWLESVIDDGLDRAKAQADGELITYHQVGNYKLAVCPLGCHPAAPLKEGVDVKAWASTLPGGKFTAGLSTLKGGKEPHLAGMSDWETLDSRLFAHPAGFLVGISGKSPAEGDAHDAETLQSKLIERFASAVE